MGWKQGGMGQKELGLGLLLLLLAASNLPQPAECKSYTIRFKDFDLMGEFYRQIRGIKVWFLKAERWWNTLARRIKQNGHPFITRAEFEEWYEWLKRAGRAAYTNRNPWVRCIKLSWGECIRRNNGMKVMTLAWCTWIMYFECEQAFHLSRRSWTKVHPEYGNNDVGLLRAPPRRLLQQQQQQQEDR